MPLTKIHPEPRAARASGSSATLRWFLFLALFSIPVLFAATRPAGAADGNWPSYRGPNARGVVEGAHLPTTWDGEAGINLLWKTAIPGLGHSSPVVWGDRVYVTTAVLESGEAGLRVGLYGDIASANDKGPVQWLLLALDRNSGDVLWQREIHKGVPTIQRHTKSTHANATPAVDGEHLAVMLGSEGLFLYDLNGNLLWKKDLGTLDSGFYLVATAQWGWASSPLIHEGRVIIQADVQGDSFLAAFDLQTGDEIWRTSRDEVPTWSTPIVAPRGDGFQIVVNGWKHIGGYDFASGRELWKMAGGGDIPVPTPVLSGNLVVITSAHGTARPIYAIRLDAEGDIQDTEYVAWQQERAGNYMQTPIVVHGIGYFCFDNGILSAYEMESGELLYKQRLGSGRSGFSGSAVADADKLFFTSEDGDTYVVATGREYRELAVNELGETFMSTPAITGNTLLLRGRSHLFAFGE